MKLPKILILLFTVQISFAQNDNKNINLNDSTQVLNFLNNLKYENKYPEGVYFTKSDFLDKRPNKKIHLIAKNVIGLKKEILDSIEHRCLFYDSIRSKKIKKAFAISYEGELFFQIKQIISNRNKKDKNQTSNFPQAFVKVITGGEKYLYTEVELVNQWAQGLAYNMGAVGGIMAYNMIRGKGVVWDISNKEFNIFRNCKDYNKFIQNKYPSGVQKCTEMSPNPIQIRIAIEQIK